MKIGKFRCMLVANNECIKILNPSENIYSSLRKGFIFCSEINDKISGSQIHVPLHIKDTKEESELQFKTYPRLITLSEKMNLEQVRITLYSFARRFFTIPENLSKFFGQRVDNLLKNFIESSQDFEDDFLEEILRDEFYLLFNPSKASSANILTEEVRKQIIESFPVKFYFFDKRTEVRSVILDRQFYFNNASSAAALTEEVEKQISAKLETLNIKECNEINNENKKNKNENYMFNFEEDSTIENYVSHLKTGDIVLILEINLENLDQASKKALTACRSIAVEEKNKDFNLNDCLNHFKLTEKLDKDNEWYCSVCKKHQKAFKKLELYYIPKNLILQLKRFEYTSTSRYRTYAEKIGALIDFPLLDVNLENFIIGPHNRQTKFDLYAVSQHFGGVGGGHYTACCKNNGNWHDFNDSSVNSSRSNSVVSSSAYMLFYRRKDQ